MLASRERILITGAAGFAGSHLVELLADSNIDAWTRSAPPAALETRAQWTRVDLLDRRAVREAVARTRPTIVYHLAGSPHVAASWQNVVEPLERNVIATHHLLDALRLNQQRCRVLISGSATIYASSSDAISEDGRIAPVSPYALSKFAQERLALRSLVEDGLEVVATRSFNHTGPRQMPAFVAPSMARQIALIERGTGEPVLRVGNLDARRDFTDVRDVVRAYVALVAKGTPGTIYNVASGTAYSIEEVLTCLLAKSSRAIRVEQDPGRMRPHDMPLLLGNVARLRATTGWAPTISFDQMLGDLLDYWRQAPVDVPVTRGRS